MVIWAGLVTHMLDDLNRKIIWEDYIKIYVREIRSRKAGNACGVFMGNLLERGHLED
jgi:hypothetical protein